ncbi:dihydroneopterin aldolase [Roseovarius atlanticus]|uniref:Dihydroneopterin aldolase n=1 Tax=Roseovarius atlanticus TaxID=1641875 RepID=A0A0T5NTD3_9RHOB|nr:disulfide bond formation protein B [Roseovarius atlanticus]KRS12194.1 dihydroneopterin aldolase [Roseovarius atlanticus]
MTRTSFVILAAGGSLALLLGAWAFQHLGGLAPCKMCIWQRWPHGVAIAVGALILLVPLGVGLARLLIGVGLLAALTTAAIGGYHTGVERGWWEGPSSCSSGSTSGMSTDELMDQIMSAPLVRCDEVAWQMLGLSMASWNMLASLLLAVFWVMALRRTA